MAERAVAWFLHAGKPGQQGPAELVREELDLPDPGADQVLVEPIYGCWGGNMTHALQRTPVDICRQRREERVVLGNSAVVRVLQVGPAVRGFREGQLAILFSSSVVDAYGYTVKALAYDAPGTMGCLATRMLLRGHELLALPEGTRHALARWAAFAGSSITAWSNWRLAYGVLRLQLGEEELPRPFVWGWGGGTTLAELDLARRHGCAAFQISGSSRRQGVITETGVTPVDRTLFPDLSYDAQRFSADRAYQRAYLSSESRFLREVERLTGGAMVNVFIDYIGQPVHRATLRALARQGVVTSAGWKLGMELGYLRAAECIARHQHVHTHYARYAEGVAAVAYAEAEGWLPLVDPEIYRFDEIPELARRYAQGDAGFYPLFSVNPE
jgi:NADPH:quinone reductase-like Zn-dependent oxidoreductase